MSIMLRVLAPVVPLLAAACSAAATSAPTPTALAPGPTTIVANQGGAVEGHTPTAFAGMGTGLFAGDDLNPSFPTGVGVQLYLTFAMPADLGVAAATISSDALHVTGTPFEDLGDLVVEPVAYDSFGPELFDLEAIGEPTGCTVASETSLSCDVTEAAQAAARDGRGSAQFRMRFERPGDGDGEQDLALFFRSDSNTNEAGLFELVVTQLT